MDTLVRAFALTSAREWSARLNLKQNENEVLHFVSGQIERMPRALRCLFKIGLTLVNWHYLVLAKRPFAYQSPSSQLASFERLRRSCAGPLRDVARFFDSMVLLVLAQHE